MTCTVGGGEGRGQRRPTRDATEPRPGSATRPVLMLRRGLTDTGAQEENRAASPLSGSDEGSSWDANDFLLGISQLKTLAASPFPRPLLVKAWTEILQFPVAPTP